MDTGIISGILLFLGGLLLGSGIKSKQKNNVVVKEKIVYKEKPVIVKQQKKEDCEFVFLKNIDSHERYFKEIVNRENRALIASVPFVGSYVYKKRILQIEPKLRKGVLVTLIMNTYNPFIDYKAVKEFIYTNSRIFQTYGGYFNIIFDSVHEKIVCGISSGLIITSYNYFSKKNRLKETGVYFKYSKKTENFINSYVDRYFSDIRLNTSIKNSIQLKQIFVENLFFENEKRMAVIRVNGVSHRVAVAPVSFREEIIGKNCIGFFTPMAYEESLWYFAPVG